MALHPILILVAGVILASVPMARGAITMDCPSGTSPTSTCIAYGSVNSWHTDGTGSSCYVRIDNPGTNVIFRRDFSQDDPQCASTLRLQQWIESNLPSGISGRVHSHGAYPYGYVYACIRGRCTASNVDVAPGPKPISCSLRDNLVFDYGQSAPGAINKTLTLPLTLNCTGKTSVKLTLRTSPKGTISLGASGLVATLQANNSALGSKISVPKGSSPVAITSTLSGVTAASGSQTGSGVLILDLLE